MQELFILQEQKVTYLLQTDSKSAILFSFFCAMYLNVNLNSVCVCMCVCVCVCVREREREREKRERKI